MSPFQDSFPPHWTQARSCSTGGAYLRRLAADRRLNSQLLHFPFCYRKWALRQQWASKGQLKDRKDFCKRIGNVGYWMICYSGKDAGDVTNRVAKMQAALPGVPLGFHWYNWHNSP